MPLHPAALPFAVVRVVTVAAAATRTPVLFRLASLPADVCQRRLAVLVAALSVRTTCPIFTFFPFVFPVRLFSRLPPSSPPLPPFHLHLPLSALLLPFSSLCFPSPTPLIHLTALLLLSILCPYQKSQRRKFVCFLVVVRVKGFGDGHVGRKSGLVPVEEKKKSVYES